MRRFALFGAVVALAACSGETAPNKSHDVAVSPSTDKVSAESPIIPPGTYAYTFAGRTTGTTVIAADGTYATTEGQLNETGTWATQGGKLCFDPAGNDLSQPIRCYSITPPDADGVRTATLDEDGLPLTLKRVS